MKNFVSYIALLPLLIACGQGAPERDRMYRIQHVSAACVSREAYDAYVEAAVWASETRDASRMVAVYASGICVRMQPNELVRVKSPGVLVSEICYPATPCTTTLYTANERLVNPI